jgi:hypothetical protein
MLRDEPHFDVDHNKLCFVSTETAIAMYAVAHPLRVGNVHARNGEAPCSRVLCPSSQTSKLSVQPSKGARILFLRHSVLSKVQCRAPSISLSVELVVLGRSLKPHRHPSEAFREHFVRTSEGSRAEVASHFANLAGETAFYRGCTDLCISRLRSDIN